MERIVKASFVELPSSKASPKPSSSLEKILRLGVEAKRQHEARETADAGIVPARSARPASQLRSTTTSSSR